MYNTMMADGGGCGKPAPNDKPKLRKAVLVGVLVGVADAAINYGIAHVLAPTWVKAPPLCVPVKTIKNIGPAAIAVKGVSKAAGIASVAMLGYSIYQDAQKYSGWNLVGAIAIDAASLWLAVEIGGALMVELTLIAGIPLTIITCIGINCTAEYAKYALLKPKGV